MGQKNYFFGKNGAIAWEGRERSEEHTSELQSHSDLVCRLLLEKKKKRNKKKKQKNKKRQEKQEDTKRKDSDT